MRKLKIGRRADTPQTLGRCVCGRVEISVDVPVFWAWHDHSEKSQRAHGAAYATYVGCWKSKVHVVSGAELISDFRDEALRSTRRFCKLCGTPLMYERGHSPKMVNLPRALFVTRTGREPRYHIAINESPEWAYQLQAVAPLKGYPGVMIERRRAPK